MLQILLILGVGFGLTALLDSDDDGGSKDTDTFTDDEDAIVDQVFRDEVETDLLDLVNEGELSQSEADRTLDAINFTSGAQNISTGGGEDVVLLNSGGSVIDTGDDSDVVLSGSGDDEVNLGAGEDFYGTDFRTVSIDDSIIEFASLDDTAGGGPEFSEENFEGGDDRVFGGTGADLISDNFGSNFINGNQGDDGISVVDDASDQGTPDTVNGGFGKDTIFVDEGDTVETGRGFDVVNVEVYNGVDEGYDTVVIEDFERGKDTLQILGQPDQLTGDGDDAPITVTPTEDGSGSIVSLGGVPIVRVVGAADLTAEDVDLVPDSRDVA